MKYWFMGLCWLIGAVIGSAQAENNFEAGSVKFVNMRASSIDLDVGYFKVNKTVLTGIKDRLTPGTSVRYQLDFSNKKFPHGVISRLEIVEASRPSCPPICL